MDKEELFEGCVLFVLTGLVAISGYFVLAYVVGQMWEWYVTPIFDIARPAYALLVGLSILVAYVTNSTGTASQMGIKREAVGHWVMFAAMFYDAVGAPLIVLLVGWLVHFFV